MFVYQNLSGDICVTFTANRPVENPEYVIKVDKDNKTIDLVSSSNAEMAARLEAAEKELDTANATIASQETRIAELEARIAELEVTTDEEA